MFTFLLVVFTAGAAGGFVGGKLGTRLANKRAAKAPRVLPDPGLMDTIQLPPGVVVHRAGWVFRSRCVHLLRSSYVRIDHRAGPGGFADNYEGQVCCDCGTVLEERKT